MSMNIHRSAKAHSIIQELSYDISSKISKELDKGKEEALFVGVVSSSFGSVTTFLRTFFRNVHEVNASKTNKTIPSGSLPKIALCYRASKLTDLTEMQISNNLDVVFWIIDFNDPEFDGEFNRAAKSSMPAVRVIPIIVYTQEDYQELKSGKDDSESCPIKIKTSKIKREVMGKGEVFQVCFGYDTDDLKKIASKIILKFSGSKQVFSSLPINGQYITSDTEKRAEGAYARVISCGVNEYCETLNESKKAEVKARAHNCLGDYIKGSNEAFVSGAVSSIFSGIGSLFSRKKK